ncbi:unnamed protein product [Heligmosomoides polygyrus]|uniref:AraC family transcriptional regulator n=1 Tax=Heligmosomoides polygyrus TaxID=6339 RepID=A0A183GIN2_HELPZ|nr:unnamed protein product [Heligmosomoides polygyrus]
MRFADTRLETSVTDWIPRDVKRTSDHHSTRWSDIFAKALNDRMTLFVSLEREDPLEHIGTRQGRVETLLVPTRATWRLT